MTTIQLLAFVIIPLALAAGGWAVVLLSERLTDTRGRRLHPGE